MTRLLLLMFVFILASPANADELRPGYLEFSQKSALEWVLVWKAPIRGGVASSTQPLLPRGCRIVGPQSHEASPVALITRSRVACAAPVAGGRIGLSNFGQSQTEVLVRVSPLGRPIQALRLTASDPVAQIRDRPDRFQVARTYFETGVEHILFGYDHLLFVVALVLLLTGAWTIAKAVTAFTIAHSITLIGTTLGVFGLPQQPVEALIALSILFLAVEIAKKSPGEPRLSQRVPWIVSFLFGLLHGFGFAGALREIGLPESDVPTALLTFNLGVEAGQLVIVFATLALLRIISRLYSPMLAPALRVSTYAIGITASYWFIDRTIG